MAISHDGQTSRGESGRWVVVRDAVDGRWALFDRTEASGAPAAFGPDTPDLADLGAAIARCIEGAP